MDGILSVNKASGPTSFAIVARLRQLSGERRIGHGGTLDPLASGMLPLFLGRATRLVEYLHEYPKTYRAGIELGITTDTYDAEGQITSQADASRVTLAMIEAALPSFVGDIDQRPPAFSAIKKDGQPLYKLARQGLAPEVESRRVTVHHLEMVAYQPPLLILDVECSKGTYIRSLAHDLGQKLGVGAHLKTLCRTSYGPFDIRDAVSMERVEEAAAGGTLASLLLPMDTALASWPSMALSEEQAKAVTDGKAVAIETGAGERLRAYGPDGRFTALLFLDAETGLWRPQKVFK
jgi:tRNA pseudouridine55 synthase